MVNQTQTIKNKQYSFSLQIGPHLSPTGGFMGMVETMDKIKATTFQYFSRNPRGSRKRADNHEDIKKNLKVKEERGLGPILAHAPYTLNPASAKDHVRDFAQLVLAEDLKSMELIPGNYYNFHPGSHVGQGVEEGIRLIAEALNKVTNQELTTKILLETMAGKGTEIGRSFEEIASIIEKVEHHEVLGVCLDTCHIHDAGFDIVNDLDGVLAAFDQIIGLNRLYAIHLNDSKNPFGSGRDRHEKIGEGSLGLKTFEHIVNHPKLRHLPMFLETPNDLAGYAKEIELLKSLQLQ